MSKIIEIQEKYLTKKKIKPFKIYEQLFLGVGKTLMGEYATEEIAKMELAKLNRKADSYTFYNIG